jgi:glucuronate isomerase
MSFITDRFLLRTDAAWRLYRDHAAPQPIIDYHCHLSPQDIAANRRFANLTEIWLEGDHYKWRAMRANGIPEQYCTGEADPYDKFLAWAETVPRCLRNPLYHWTHLELQRYFGITELLDRESAPSIWERANARLATDAMSVHGILEAFGVRVVCTTDDPADGLDAHTAIRASGLRTRVYPTFRPDRALDVHQPAVFNPWVDRLSATANLDIVRFGDYSQADALGAYLDRLDQEGVLPKTIVYNLNPADNYVFAAMIGNFQDGSVPGKVQFGSGWWFLDQKEGMEWQMNALSNVGLLQRFVGMTTDSRSFLSFPRHEYFRRVLCNLLGDDVERGLVPDDDRLLGPLVEDVCFGNAQRYFGLELQG